MLVRNSGREPLWLSHRAGGAPLFVEPDGELAVPAYEGAPGWIVHFGHESQLHRALLFSLLGKEKRT